jgi:UDP-hydrolysing UDP-N-acetyl-D-glucosamine 2-epimerase
MPDIIRRDGFPVIDTVYSIVEGETLQTMSKSLGLGIIEFSTVLTKYQPDIVVTIADRFDTLATALCASFQNIPLAHIQGGELSGSIDDSVRHAITKLSHIHFPATHQAKRVIIRMGENPDNVFKVGCPSIDLLKDIPEFKDFPRETGIGAELDPSQPFLTVLLHPVTTEYRNNEKYAQSVLKAVIQTGIQIVWLWPNVDAGSEYISKVLRTYHEEFPLANIRFYRNLPPLEFYSLLKASDCLIGNSSVGLREGAYLGIPVVNVGSRQNKRERAHNVLDVPCKIEEIIKGIERQKELLFGHSDLYGDGGAGKQIAGILATVELDIRKVFHGM